MTACGVCRTDLHLVQGDVPLHRPAIVPGHQVVGTVDALGTGSSRFAIGERVGAAWLAGTCGLCRFCQEGRENLCFRASFTGLDIDGGYAEAMVADERFLYRLPAGFADLHAAPLLCAGIIGYRALRAARIRPGARLGLYGFGSSAHVCAQIAMALGAQVYVVTRSSRARELAESLGAEWVGSPGDPPPVPLSGSIIFAPDGGIVPSALESLDRGGVVVIAGIHLSQIPPIHYSTQLFGERSIRSVTANTRADGEELLSLSRAAGIHVTVSEYPLRQADRALEDLDGGLIRGTAVLNCLQ